MNNQAPLSVLFSDLDGTLVHYPKDLQQYATIEDHTPTSATITYNTTGEKRLCTTLLSKTGGPSYISNRTKDLIAQLRSLGVIFVIITGARTSTYIKRRPYLPSADFEFYENGGRKLKNGVLDPSWTDRFVYQVGKVAERETLLPEPKALEEREGSLWELCRRMTREGWKVDTRDYMTNFRVDVAKSEGKTESDFQKIVEEECAAKGLATSFNLGKADFYPAGSGKANAAKHVLEELGLEREEAAAMFDDDNDLELGRFCGRCFLPGVTHKSVLEEIEKQPSWVLSERKGVLGTESVLEMIIEIRKGSRELSQSVAAAV